MEFKPKDNSNLMFKGKDENDYSSHEALSSADEAFMNLNYPKKKDSPAVPLLYKGKDGNDYSSFENLNQADQA